METKEPVSVENFEDGVKTASPMPLSGLKKTKSSYDYFKELGDKVLASLKNGTSPLLPNKDGFVDLQPAYNINSNEKAEGLTQIMLLTKAAELGVPSKGFVTFETLQKAQKAGVENAGDEYIIEAGQQGGDQRNGTAFSVFIFPAINIAQLR